MVSHFTWPQEPILDRFCETRPPVNMMFSPLVLGSCWERAGKDSLTSGLGPLSSGRRPLGRGAVKILEIRFVALGWVPELCSEEERAPWLELLSFGDERCEHDPTHSVSRCYRQVPSLRTSQHDRLDMGTGAAQHAEG